MTNPTALVSKLWNYCSILRDDRLSYGDYVGQLILLRLAHFGRPLPNAIRCLSLLHSGS
jgi:hypothetical protein